MNRSLALAVARTAAPLAALRGQGAPWDWADGPLADVVRGIRAALDAVR